MRAKAKAAAQATVRADRQARLLKRVVMPEELAAPRLPAWGTAMAATLLVVYVG
jgi:hypothetical protein